MDTAGDQLRSQLARTRRDTWPLGPDQPAPGHEAPHREHNQIASDH